MLELSTYTEIKFNNVLPGNIFEESFDIFNKSNESIVMKINIVSLNSEFENLDEYVYSIRKNTNYDYNEKFIFLLAPYKNIQFKVALKVPSSSV